MISLLSCLQQAIESGLPDKDVLTMCMKFAELERSLGEIDRSRAIYVHASNYADPNNSDFWKKWNDFEIQHGNEDTFREMLRIKRTVAASRSQVCHTYLFNLQFDMNTHPCLVSQIHTDF
jgi:pre-mRNA-splicing factor SYF1